MRAVGLHVCGPNAAEIAQGFAVAMRMGGGGGATKSDFDFTIGVSKRADAITSISLLPRMSGFCNVASAASSPSTSPDLSRGGRVGALGSSVMLEWDLSQLPSTLKSFRKGMCYVQLSCPV